MLLRIDEFLGINRGQMSRLTLLDLPKSSDLVDNKATVMWLQDLAGDSIIIQVLGPSRNGQGSEEGLSPSLFHSCLGTISDPKLLRLEIQLLLLNCLL